MQLSQSLRRASLGVVLLAALLAGCASPYGKNALFGGFSEEKISDTTYRLRYNGNGYTGEDQVVKYWLYRAAELTREGGYEYFGIVSANKHASTDIPSDSPFVKTRGGGSAPIYIYTPGYTIRTWSKDGYVTMYHTRIGAVNPDQAYALHAETVLTMLKPYVDSGGKAKDGPTREQVVESAIRAGVVPSFTPPVPEEKRL